VVCASERDAHHFDVVAVGAGVCVELLGLLDEGVERDELVRPLHVVDLARGKGGGGERESWREGIGGDWGERANR